MRWVGIGIAAAVIVTMVATAPDRASGSAGPIGTAVVNDEPEEDSEDDDDRDGTDSPSTHAGDGSQSVTDDALAALGLPPRGRPLAGEMAGDWPARLLLFSSTDLWRHGAFVHGGVLWSPGWLDRDGFVLKLVFGGGAYRYRSGTLGNTEVLGQQLSGAILPGMRASYGPVTVALFAGPELQDHRLQPNDPGAALQGSRFGLRFGFDVWYQPSEWVMASADGSISTIATSYSARLAAGYRLFNAVYVGPEVAAFTGGNYRQQRVGVHATGLRVGLTEWSAAMGWARDSDARSGIYGKLGVLTRY
jgi:hypothetical protein